MVDGISKSDINDTDQRLDELQVVLERLRSLAAEVLHGNIIIMLSFKYCVISVASEQHT